MKKGRTELIEFLDSLAIKTTTRDHEAVFSVGEAAYLKNEIPGGHTKNLFLKDRKNRYFLLTLGDYGIVDLKTLHHKIGASGRLSFGSAEKLDDYLGLYPGAVSVFGAINDVDHHVTFILDQALMENDCINAHPMTNEATTTIARNDLLTFLRATGHEPQIIEVSEKPLTPDKT